MVQVPILGRILTTELNTLTTDFPPTPVGYGPLALKLQRGRQRQATGFEDAVPSPRRTDGVSVVRVSLCKSGSFCRSDGREF